jgi:hypothetical protein
MLRKDENVYINWVWQLKRMTKFIAYRCNWENNIEALYINKIQQDATVCRCLFTAQLLYIFSGVRRIHNQEYIKL